ncbi:Signalosome complex subunit [Pseudozyma hubeiensis]|nr:Signalosome complex subunit [Pseudozyma hubeiensis]
MPLVIPDSSQIPTVAGDYSTVTTEALRGLTPGTLVHEIKRLQDSVARLQDSNRQIEQFVHESGNEIDEHDRDEMRNACTDNVATIGKQNDVVEKLFDVLQEKTGHEDTQAHYGLTRPTQTAEMATMTTSTDGPTAMQEDSEGVFL